MKSLLPILTVAALLVVSCSQNEDIEPTVKNDSVVAVEKEAVVIEDEGEPFESTWTTGEVVQLYNGEDASGTLTLTQEVDDNNANFSGEVPEEAEYALYPALTTRSTFTKAPFTITVGDQTQWGNDNPSHLLGYNFMYGRVNRRNLILLRYALCKVRFCVIMPYRYMGVPDRFVIRSRRGEQIFMVEKGMFFHQDPNSIVMSDCMVLNLERVYPDPMGPPPARRLVAHMAFFPIDFGCQDMVISVVTKYMGREYWYDYYYHTHSHWRAGRRYSYGCYNLGGGMP